jgi:hypothetical protein
MWIDASDIEVDDYLQAPAFLFFQCVSSIRPETTTQLYSDDTWALIVLGIIYRLGDVNSNPTMNCFQLLTNEAGLADQIKVLKLQGIVTCC